MADRETVIYDIERCICHVPDACRDCSRYGHNDDLRCMEALMSDAMELLKEQEDLGKELENAIELIHKKNERIEKLLKEQEAMNVDAFVQWCIDSHIMGDATVRGIKYWVEKYKEYKGIKEGR